MTTPSVEDAVTVWLVSSAPSTPGSTGRTDPLAAAIGQPNPDLSGAPGTSMFKRPGFTPLAVKTVSLRGASETSLFLTASTTLLHRTPPPFTLGVGASVL